MSRHHTVTRTLKGPLDVTAGWDQALQHFFLSVNDPEKEESDTGASNVHESLDDQRLRGPGRGTLHRPRNGYGWDELLAVLAHLNLTLPAEMLAALRDDQRHNTGNRNQEWS